MFYFIFHISAYIKTYDGVFYARKKKLFKKMSKYIKNVKKPMFQILYLKCQILCLKEPIHIFLTYISDLVKPMFQIVYLKKPYVSDLVCKETYISD